jgi:hypothetical protein
MKPNTTDPYHWIRQEQQLSRELVLVIDSGTAPDAVPGLFRQSPVREYIRLFQGTEFEDLLDVTPWLIRIDNSMMPAINYLLQCPDLNWGWIASAVNLDLKDVARHWHDRLVTHDERKRWFYRFQDNQVIARHLGAMNAQQIPLLLGPLSGALSWDGESWQSFENDHPAVYPLPFDKPWLQVPETPAICEAIEIAAAQDWLWDNHRHATANLLISVPLNHWVQHQLRLATEWSWSDTEHLYFLLEHKLDPLLADHPAWESKPDESPQAHFQRVKLELTKARQRQTQP